MRLIDADKLQRRVQSVATEAWKLKLEAKVETTLNQFLDYVEQSPTIDAVSMVHGKWIEAEEDWRQQIAFWRCSECGHATSTMYNFCPNCGARMFAKDINVPNKKGANNERR